MRERLLALLHRRAGSEVSLDESLVVLPEILRAMLETKPDRPLLIFVTGGTGAGKSTQIAERLKVTLPGLVSIFSIDMFYRGWTVVRAMEAQHGRPISWDEPLAVDLSGAVQQLSLLRQGEVATIPRYNFERSEREGEERMSATPIILVEGLFALHEQFQPLIDLGLYVDVDVHGQIIRRVLRDIVRKRREPNDILFELAQTALPMQHRHVVSTRERADLVIKNDFRPETEMLRRGSSRPQIKVSGWPIPGRLAEMNAECLGRMRQDDRYFTANDRDLIRSGEEFRIREDAGELTLTYKGPAVGPLGQRFVFTCSLEEATAAQLLTYYRATLVQVSKTRRLFLHGGMLIGLDTVSLVSPDGVVVDSRQVTEVRPIEGEHIDRQSIDQFLVELGLDPRCSTHESYFAIALNPTLLPLD